jgi:putative glycosyltransferase (TIGR04372 family)
MGPTKGADFPPRLPVASDIPVIQSPYTFHPGSHSKRPFRIVAICLERTLGDFAKSLCFAASVKQLFEHASLAVYFHDDRHYKTTLIKSCPEVDTVIRYDGDVHMPMEAFDVGWGAPARAPYPEFYEGRFPLADLILTPGMMEQRFLGSFEQTARLRIPEGKAMALTKRLVDAGVDPDRWFCAVHYREPTYHLRRPDPLRDIDPKTIQNVTDRIIDELGGQVVRVGHPGMTPFRPRNEFIDLAPLGDSDFMLQLFAMSRARFMVASASGPHNCTGALGTPTGAFGCNVPAAVWNPQDARLLLHLLTPDGDRVSVDLALRRGIYGSVILQEFLRRGYRVQNASGGEIFGMVKFMHDQTQDTLGWRTHWYERKVAKTNKFQWPLAETTRCHTLVFPDLAPGRHLIE